MTQKKTYLSWLLGLICAFSLMIVFLITSVEAVAYWTPHYYENEYTRYQVADDVHMEMDDLLYVTDEMMAYLRGSRDDLNIDTVVDGTPREFFNAREKAHMADVRNLFLGGLALRRLCLFLAAASVALLALFKVPLKHLLPRMLCAGTVLFLGVTALLAGIISEIFYYFPQNLLYQRSLAARSADRSSDQHRAGTIFHGYRRPDRHHLLPDDRRPVSSLPCMHPAGTPQGQIRGRKFRKFRRRQLSR